LEVVALSGSLGATRPYHNGSSHSFPTFFLRTVLRRSALEKWFQELDSGFAERVLPIDKAVAAAWVKMYAANQKTGRSLPSVDSLLAATAWQRGLAIATRNTAEFPPEVKLVNPWE